MAVLRYGIDSSVHLELADGTLPQQCGTPQGQPLDDPRAAVARALVEPLDYPPLARGTTPGDRVVLALDRSIPQASQVIAAVIESLVEAGVDPDGIAILRTRSDAEAAGDDPCRLLSKSLLARISLLTHDPADRRSLAYLAANDAGEPILIHRALHEADLVLPIGCLRGDSAAGYFGIHGSVFPMFSDARTLGRFRKGDRPRLPPSGPQGASHKRGLSPLDRGSQHRQLTAESDHVAWLLGINFTIQVVPGGGERIMHVVAGQSDAVRRRGRQLYRAAWDGPMVRRASLVVAAIEGGPGLQTWEDFGRALDTASSLVEDGGAMAVCCDLAADPGPAVQQMAGAPSRAALLRRIGKDPPEDALPAAQLARALDRGKVYLLSRLPPSLVEELDVIPIAGGEELARLARQHKSGILLANAPHAMVTTDEED